MSDDTFMAIGKNADGDWARPPGSPTPRSKPRQVGDKPVTEHGDGFVHTSHHGFGFYCPNVDFSEPVIAYLPDNFDDLSQGEAILHFAQDVAEMIGFHAINIYPHLNSFQGYDAFTFQLAPRGTAPPR